ncbi:MAG: hypothetical protein RLZ06_300 [Actinomycetota bacterium]|jgi:uncharacterized membrane protein YfcA
MWTLLAVSLVGFVAQLINSSLGMAFGIITTTALVSLAYSAPMASSIVHLAEIATSASNGIFHYKNGNIDKKVFLALSIPGGVGAFIGALLLSSIDLAQSKPLTASILLILGLTLVVRYVRLSQLPKLRKAMKRWLVPLGFFSGMIDANAGGGWGTIVTTSLHSSSILEPRKVIGTSTSARLLVAISGSAGFLIGIGAEKIDWLAVLMLALGGLVAAPIAARVVARANQLLVGLVTGFLIIELNLRQLLVAAEVDSTITGASMFAVLLIAVAVTKVTMQKRDSR